MLFSPLYTGILFSVQLLYLSFRNDLPRELHWKLKSDLITGYLQRREHLSRWKEQFRIHSNIDKVINGPIDGHFDFLESTGKLRIGDYEVLKTIFKYVDVRALEVIDDASKNIKAALQNN